MNELKQQYDELQRLLNQIRADSARTVAELDRLIEFRRQLGPLLSGVQVQSKYICALCEAKP